MPPALKSAIEQKAEKNNSSVNVFALRCFEECLEDPDFPSEVGEIWNIARGLTASWETDGKDALKEEPEYKLKTAVAALEEIGKLVEWYARQNFGTDDISKLYDCTPDRRFRPYQE
jgi:hypothetical protein